MSHIDTLMLIAGACYTTSIFVRPYRTRITLVGLAANIAALVLSIV